MSYCILYTSIWHIFNQYLMKMTSIQENGFRILYKNHSTYPQMLTANSLYEYSIIFKEVAALKFYVTKMTDYTMFCSNIGLSDNNLSKLILLRSIVLKPPSRIISIILLPTAGACCIPCPLKPAAMYKLW